MMGFCHIVFAVNLLSWSSAAVSIIDTNGTTPEPFHDTNGTTPEPFHDTDGTTPEPIQDTSGTTPEPFRDTSGTTSEPFRDTSGTTPEPFRGRNKTLLDAIDDMNISAIDFGMDDIDKIFKDVIGGLNKTLEDAIGDMNISDIDFGMDDKNITLAGGFGDHWPSMEDFDFEDMEGGGMFSFPSFDFEMHLQESIGMLGVMSCLADDAGSDLETISMAMGGILGAIYGQVQGEGSSNHDDFIDAGSVAGISGAASGMLDLDKGQTPKDFLPTSDEIEKFFKEDHGGEEVSVQALRSMMERSKKTLEDIMNDVNGIIEDMKDTIRASIEHGTSDEIARTSAGAGHLAGQIGDFAKASFSHKPLNKKEMHEKIKMAAMIVVQTGDILKQDLKNKGGSSADEKSNIVKDSYKIGKAMGEKGAQREELVISDMHAAVAMAPFNIAVGPTKPSHDVMKGEKTEVKSNDDEKEAVSSCIRGVLPIIDEIESLKMMMEPEVDFLDWEPPFKVDDDVSYSQSGLPGYLSGDRYNEEWDFKPLSEVVLPDDLKSEDFTESFVPHILRDPLMVDLINFSSRMKDNALIDFLKGTTLTKDLPLGALKKLPSKVLKLIPNKDSIPIDNLIEFLRQDHHDMKEGLNFISNISASRKIELLEAASTEFYAGEFHPNPALIHMVQEWLADAETPSEVMSLIDKLNPSLKISYTCPYGLSAAVLESIDELSNNLDDINDCIEALGSRMRIDEDAFHTIANSTSSSATSANELMNLKYMINFGSLSISLNKSEIEKVGSLDIQKYLLPYIPSFGEAVEGIGSMVLPDNDDLEAINRSGLISCGIVIHFADGDSEMDISDEFKMAATETCSKALKPFMKILQPKKDQCMGDFGCGHASEMEPSEMDFLIKYLKQQKPRHLPDGPDSLTGLKPGDLQKLLVDNSDEIEKLQPIDKVVAIHEMKDDLSDFLTDHKQYESLASKIPLSLLEDLQASDDSFMKILTSVKWHPPQALRINGDLQHVTSFDIREIGSLASGLTCHDVMNMNMDLILQIAQVLDFQIRDSVSPDLAECVAVKLFLHLKSRYPGKKQLLEKLGSTVPAVFAAFFPVNLVSEIPHCAQFFIKLMPHIHRLFPTPVSRLYLEDLASYAVACFSDSGEHGHESEAAPEPVEMKKEEMMRARRDIKNPPIRREKPSVEEFDKEEFLGDMMDGVPGSYFQEIREIICFIRPEFILGESENSCKAMMKAMHKCLPKISNGTLAAIHAKMAEIYSNPIDWNSTVLQELGPFVATLPSEILDMIPAEDFSSAYDAIKPPPRKNKVLKGDLTTPMLDAAKIMNFPAINGSGPSPINTAFSPFKYEDFFRSAVGKISPKYATAEDIRKLGPDAIPYLPQNDMEPEAIEAFLELVGKGDYHLEEEEKINLKRVLMMQIQNYSNDVNDFSDEDLFMIARRASIFNVSEIAEYFRFSKIGTLAKLGEAVWKNADQVNAVLEAYMGKREYGDLSGPELVAMGNMHCHLTEAEINDFSSDSLKFALHELGKLHCFDQDHLDTYKAAVKKAFTTIDAATLLDMGVLAAGFAASELVEFSKTDPKSGATSLDKDVVMIPSIALRVMPATRIISGFDESLLLRMGTVNGGILLLRQDVFDKLSDSSKNAVFAAATGLNAGVYATFIEYARSVDAEAMEDIEKQMQGLMKQLNKAFQEARRTVNFEMTEVNTFSVFGLMDISMAERPEADDLAEGISVTEIKSSFETKYLNDRVVVNYINEYTEDHSIMIDVLNGESTLNDISDDDWETVPVKILQGFRREAIQEISPEKLAKLLDSDDVSKDPASLSKILDKLELDQFEDALKILTAKMNETDDKMWRPPINIQNVVANSYFRFDHGDKEEALKSFLKFMCPFAAGVGHWQIRRLPSEEAYIEPMIECFDPSYRDLDSFQKRGMVDWVFRTWKRNNMNAEKAILLKNFLLDFPLRDIRSAFTLTEVVKYVQSGIMVKLDTSNKMFHTLAGFIIKVIRTNNAEMLNDVDFMQMLGKAKCEINVRRVKKVLDSSNLKKLLEYTLKNCKNHEDELEQSLEECTSETSSRLQRCQILQDEMSRIERKSSFSSSMFSSSFFSSYSSSSVQTVTMERPSIKEYESMKTVMDMFKEDNDKSLSEFDSSDIRDVASAFGVLKPKEIDEIPDAAILENIDVLKNNTNLSKNQKRKIFKKFESAGFEVTSSESIMELGEFVTSVRPEQFKQLSADGIKDSLGELTKHAKEFSRAQRRAIMDTLNDGNVTDIIHQDLGELVTEIPLSDLDDVVIEKDDLKEIGKQPWSRGQAANLFRKYREKAGLEDSTLGVADIQEMGRTAVGLSCKDIMNILDDEAYDAAQAMVEETSRSLTLDMNECISKKLRYSLQVLHGEDFMANETDPDLPSTLEYIPGDIAMMMPTDQLDLVPTTACMTLMGNIGKAKVDLIPLSGAGLTRRKALANITMKCIEGNRLTEDALDASEALTFGQLVCDLEIENWEKFELDSFIEMLNEFSACYYRLSEDKIKYILSRIFEKYGSDSSLWTEDTLAALGPMVALMDADVIDALPVDAVYETLDELTPSQLDPELPAHKLVKYESVYGKFIESVMSQRSPSRRRRSVTAPTYDEMVVLGAGNAALSEAELAAITDDDLSNALSILGSISTWTNGQISALIEKLKGIYGNVDTWASKVIGDAQFLIRGLTSSELASLVIDDIETTAQLGQVNFTNEEKYVLVEAYLSGAGVALSELSSSEIAGFASLACGIASDKLAEIATDSLKDALSDLGELDCFTEDQFDFLKNIAVLGRNSTVPTAPEIYEMGTIAAGLSTEDLAALPVDSISFIQPTAFLKMPTSRIRDGLNELQLLAAGAGNIAALMSPEIFDELTIEQRNALRKAAYGDEAVLEDESATDASPTEQVDESATDASPTEQVDPADDNGGGGGGDGDDDDDDDVADPGDNTVDDDDDSTDTTTQKSGDSANATTTTKSSAVDPSATTTPGGSSAAVLPSFINISTLMLVSIVLMCKRF